MCRIGLGVFTYYLIPLLRKVEQNEEPKVMRIEEPKVMRIEEPKV